MSNNVFYRFFFSPGPGSSLGPHFAFSCPVGLVSFNLELFLGLPLSFMSLPFLKDTSHLFYRLSLVLCVSGISSWLDSDYASLSGVTRKRDSFSLMVKELRILVVGGGGTEWITWCWVGIKDIKKNWRGSRGRNMCVCDVCVGSGCVCVLCMYGSCACVCKMPSLCPLTGPGNSNTRSSEHTRCWISVST